MTSSLSSSLSTLGTSVLPLSTWQTVQSTATLGTSVLPPSTWQTVQSITTQTLVSSPSPSPSTWTESTDRDEPEPTLATQITVGMKPDICTSSDYTYQTEVNVNADDPLIVRIKAKDGWGPENSTWNFNLGGGGKITKPQAPCPGSACSKVLQGNQALQGAELTQLNDTSLSMKVPPDMKASVMVSFEVVQDSSRKRWFAKREAPYTLSVSARPICELPIAQNCTDWDFTSDAEQWEAYNMDEFVRKYVAENDINSFEQMREKSSGEFWTKWISGHTKCDISQEMDCKSPEDIATLCRQRPTLREIQGLLMTDGVVNFFNLMRLVYSSVEKVRGRIGDAIDVIVNKIWKPAAKQRWHKIMSILASSAGLIIGVIVLLGALITPLLPLVLPAAAVAVAGVAIGVASAAAIGVSNAFGLAGGIGGLHDDPDDAREIQNTAANYKLDAANKLLDMENSFPVFMKSTKVGQEAISTILQQGIWTGDRSWGLFNDNGFGKDVTGWFERMMVTQYVMQMLLDNEVYLLIILYGEHVTWDGTAPNKGTSGFSKELCEKRFVGDPSWKFAASCDITLGGKPGMAIITRPSKFGSESKVWFENSFSYDGITPSPQNVITSIVSGLEKHGSNYTALNQDWPKVLSEEGPDAIKDIFEDQSNDQAGLYTLPACVIEDMAYMPGIHQATTDYNDGPVAGVPVATAPCSCKDFEYTSTDGTISRFKDFASDNTMDSITKGCKIVHL